MKILILEDDPLAADFLEKLINDNYLDFEVVGKAASVQEACRIYNSKFPDLIIMDINLGDHISFELFDYIDASNLTVIFATSFQEFALKAIKVEAVDYLLKPINIDSFKTAIRKVEHRIRMKMHLVKEEEGEIELSGKKVLIYEDFKLMPVELRSIIKITSQGPYSDVHIKDGKVIRSSKNIGLYAKVFENSSFFRIHDSCLVNTDHINKYTPGANAYITMSDKSREPVSRRRKREFLTLYKNL